jgi:hypothetical protein
MIGGGVASSEDVTFASASSDTIAALKERIFSTHMIDGCKLIFAGNCLEDHRTLEDYYIADGTTLFLQAAPTLPAAAAEDEAVDGVEEGDANSKDLIYDGDDDAEENPCDYHHAHPTPSELVEPGPTIPSSREDDGDDETQGWEVVSEDHGPSAPPKVVPIPPLPSPGVVTATPVVVATLVSEPPVIDGELPVVAAAPARSTHRRTDSNSNLMFNPTISLNVGNGDGWWKCCFACVLCPCWAPALCVALAALLVGSLTCAFAGPYLMTDLMTEYRPCLNGHGSGTGLSATPRHCAAAYSLVDAAVGSMSDPQVSATASNAGIVLAFTSLAVPLAKYIWGWGGRVGAG